MNNPINIYYPLDARNFAHGSRKKETKLGLTGNSDPEREIGIERYITFRCRDYRSKDKKDIANITYDTKNLFHIHLPLPNEFSDRITQDWHSREKIISAAQIAGVAAEQIGSWIANKFGKLGAAAASTFQRSLGVTVNPAEEMMYSGPQFRNFVFNFDFISRSEQEEKVVKLILLLFKRYGLPRLGLEEMWINFPAIWEISVSGIDSTTGQNNLLNFGFENKQFALTDYNTNFTPDGSFNSLKSGFPPKVSISLSFVETRPLYRDDVEGPGGKFVDVEETIRDFLGPDMGRYRRG